MSTDPTHPVHSLLAAGEPQPLLTPQAPTSPDQFVPNRGATSGAVEALSGFSLPDWSPFEWIGYSSLIVVSLLLTAVAVSTLWWMLHAWRS